MTALCFDVHLDAAGSDLNVQHLSTIVGYQRLNLMLGAMLHKEENATAASGTADP